MNKPDGFIGAIMALEGIPNATALLHGQNGCRKGLLLSQKMCPRPDRSRNLDIPVYMYRPVVPFSGVNQGDYTGNSLPKLVKALEYVSAEDYDLIGVICSPGLSIIGDDCRTAIRNCGMNSKTVMLENDELGEDAASGFDYAISTVLTKICTGERHVLKDAVTVTGLSIMHKDWHSVADELGTVSRLMGLEIICFTGAGSNTGEIAASANAEYILDIAPDFCTETRKFYESRGLKPISIGKSPVGFDAVEEIIRRMSEVTGKDPGRALEMLQKYRRRAYDCIIASDKGFHGRRFSIDAPDSVKTPLKEFLEDSFSMKYSDTDYEYLFADGNRCVMEKASGKCKRCIDLGFPSNKVDFSRNPVLGMEGTMYILDSLFL